MCFTFTRHKREIWIISRSLLRHLGPLLKTAASARFESFFRKQQTNILRSFLPSFLSFLPRALKLHAGACHATQRYETKNEISIFGNSGWLPSLNTCTEQPWSPAPLCGSPHGQKGHQMLRSGLVMRPPCLENQFTRDLRSLVNRLFVAGNRQAGYLLLLFAQCCIT